MANMPVNCALPVTTQPGVGHVDSTKRPRGTPPTEVGIDSKWPVKNI